MRKFIKWLKEEKEITGNMRFTLMMLNYFLGLSSGIIIGSIIF